MDKTLVMKILDQKKINYKIHDYINSNLVDAVSVANFLNENPSKVFKTLVTVGKSKNHYVFLVPSNKTLDLKKASKVVDEKNIELIHQKELLPLTGYIHGGCSPIGMKKTFPTVIDSSAASFDTIFISGGKIGYQIEISPNDLIPLIKGKLFDISKDM